MENEFGESRSRPKLRLATDNAFQSDPMLVRLSRFNLRSNLSDPPTTFELIIEPSPAGEGIRLAYIYQTRMKKLAPPEVLLLSGHDPEELTYGRWEEYIIDRPLWLRVLHSLWLRKFSDVVLHEVKKFYGRQKKDVQMRERRRDRALDLMKNLQTNSDKCEE